MFSGTGTKLPKNICGRMNIKLIPVDEPGDFATGISKRIRDILCI